MVDKISDIWDISDDEGDTPNYDKVISSKEWERMNENFGNVGYKEGVIEGKDITIQKGFDRGYAEGAVIGREFGRLRGILNTLLEFYSSLINQGDIDDEDIKDMPRLPDKSTLDRVKYLENELACLTADKLFTKGYFQSPSTSEENINNPWKVENNDTDTRRVGLTCSCQKDTGNHCESSSSCKERKNNDPGCCERDIQHSKRTEQILKEYREEVNKILSELEFTI